MSYYALFQGWLLLGKPPGCLCTPTSFLTEWLFGGLSWWSGLFPFRLTKLIPRSLTAGLWSNGIRSLAGVGKLVGPRTHPVLYLHC